MLNLQIRRAFFVLGAVSHVMFVVCILWLMASLHVYVYARMLRICVLQWKYASVNEWNHTRCTCICVYNMYMHMHIYIYIYIYFFFVLFCFVFVFVYVCICICMCMCMSAHTSIDNTH